MARTFKQPRSARFIERLRETMGAQLWSADELADAMCTHRQNLLRYLGHLMQAQPRAAHIADYRKPPHGGRYAYLYKLGDMPDARHPKARNQ